jgi:hypothetical protein
VVEDVEGFGADLDAGPFGDGEVLVDGGGEGDLLGSTEDAGLRVAEGSEGGWGEGGEAVQAGLAKSALAAAGVADERSDLVGAVSEAGVGGAETDGLGEATLRGDQAGGPESGEDLPG